MAGGHARERGVLTDVRFVEQHERFPLRYERRAPSGEDVSVLEQLVLVGDGKRNDRFGSTGNVGVLESELVGGVDRLSDLVAGRKIGTHEDVQLLDRLRNLMAAHERHHHPPRAARQDLSR